MIHHPSRRRLSAVIGAAIILSVGTLAWLWDARGSPPIGTADSPNDVQSSTQRESALPVGLARVVRGDLRLSTSAPAVVIGSGGADAVEITAQTSGCVMSSQVIGGRHFSKGEVMLRLDQREASIELKRAEAEYTSALAKYTTNLADAESMDLKVAGQPVQPDGKSNTAADAAADGKEDLGRFLDGTMRETVMKGVTGVTAAELAVERARLNLERSVIAAPFDCRVLESRVTEGQCVQPGTVVGTVVETRGLRLEADVIESDFGEIRVGAPVEVEFLSRVSVGAALSVTALAPSVDRNTNRGRVWIDLPNGLAGVLPGMSASARIVTNILKNRLMVPLAAVLNREGEDLVFIVSSESRAQWTRVGRGEDNGEWVEIVERPDLKIREGDMVIASGHEMLAHNSLVRAIRD